MLARLGRLALPVLGLLLGTATPALATHDGANSVLWAIGDADASSASAGTASRITGQVDRFLYLGDVYTNGTASEFANNFDPVWGKWKSVGTPTPGNHDAANHATGYDPYWGSRAPHTNGGHYFAVQENGWEILSLNSEQSMAAGSAQYEWLKGKLASGGNCRIAIMHKPRYSAGSHGDNPSVQPLWDLMAGKVKLVLAGHDHNMQRAKPVNGITELISGAAMRLYDANNADTRFAFVRDTERGILRINLTKVGSNADGGATATHAFVAADDGATLDSGSVPCTPPAPTASVPTEPAPAPAPTTHTFVPEADARVVEATPTANFAGGDLRTDGGSDRDVESYVRFSTSGLTGTVRSAKLRVYAYTGTGNGPAVYTTSPLWTERLVTWSQRPARTSGRDDKGAVAANSWVTYDVTPFVTGNGTFSFALATSSSDGVDFYSREDTQKPQLVVTTG